MIELIGQKVNIICAECGCVRTMRLHDVRDVFALEDICDECKMELIDEQPEVPR